MSRFYAVYDVQICTVFSILKFPITWRQLYIHLHTMFCVKKTISEIKFMLKAWHFIWRKTNTTKKEYEKSCKKTFHVDTWNAGNTLTRARNKYSTPIYVDEMRQLLCRLVHLCNLLLSRIISGRYWFRNNFFSDLILQESLGCHRCHPKHPYGIIKKVNTCFFCNRRYYVKI